MQIKSLAVFCGSKSGDNPVYIQHAEEIGSMLAKNQITLVYGGGNKGIMGAVANSAMNNGGKVIGVIPKLLTDREHQHDNITELTITDDMHERKKKLYELCDAALILPGGFGTMDELFELLTWNQLFIHNKLVFLLNSNGFYDHLISHIRHLEETGFLYEKLEENIVIISEPWELHSYITN
ncbi:MAG: TIGR00730 family Rossman fold protein [Bacteroidetes bacterium]|nr:TIGR00730 family Rossman fold protein [Bacteroidota bacterium]